MDQTTLSARADNVRYTAAHGVTVRESRYAAGLAVPEHWHVTGYACVTLAGSVVDTIGSRHSPAAAGYSCYVPPFTPHANVFGTAGARCLLFEIESGALEWFGEAGLDTVRPWSAFGGQPAWGGLLLYRTLRSGAATSLDVEAFLLTAFGRRPAPPLKNLVAPAWLGRVRDRLESELRRPPSLAVLAREADVHPMHMVRVFRAHRGCSPGEYVQTRRIAHACRLLVDTDIPLVRLGLDLGYHDQSHFTRAFRARVGVPPGAYRAHARGVRRFTPAPT
ncbi:MAG TPA: helix-turn-helix domain-containing protein [Gemmatimonadales bacterium]|nr:helix-turn-helix domain-containing protein [Gemmatimonadales bacterium]